MSMMKSGFLHATIVCLAGVAMVAPGVRAQEAPTQLTPAQRARRTPIVEVFERTRDGVVNIAATQVVERRSRSMSCCSRRSFNGPRRQR